MANELNLMHPWMIAVWPGMGHVAMSAGYYLLAKLDMEIVAEFSPRDLFEMEHVEVKSGLIHPGKLPRSRIFAWKDPNQRHDIVVFIGEAQPPVGKYAFCRHLVEFARQIGVERVFTFAAMATNMHPAQPARVFGAATDNAGLEELVRLKIELLEDGQIGGLNGVLLGVASELGTIGTCLLGEMPHIFAQLPFPKASQAVLEVFCKISGITLDFAELAEQAGAIEEKLEEILSQLQGTMAEGEMEEDDEDGGFPPPPSEEPKLSPEDEQRIEELFKQAATNRSKAYELKRELDKLDVFRDYEDRFLDLFKRPQ